MILSKDDVLSALSRKPGAARTSAQIRQILRSPPIGIESTASVARCTGARFFVDARRTPIDFAAAESEGWPPTACKEFSLLAADFGEYLTAISYRCVDDASGRYLLLEEACDPALVRLAGAVASRLGLRYVDAASLHAMSLDWDELPRDQEFDFVARLHHSDPNAFSLMFFEWA